MADTSIERASAALPAKSLSGLALTGLVALIAVAAAGYGHRWWTVGRFIESTDDAYVGGEVTVIAPKVAGDIAAVPGRDNQAVRLGALLVKVDDRDYRAALGKAEAAVAGQPGNIAH